MDIVVSIYQLTNSFPAEELYGLVSQIRRSALSLPSSIAEGSGRKNDKDFSRFLSIALGSSYELETQLILSERLKLINDSKLNQALDELTQIQKMLYKLRKKLNN